MSKIRSSSCVLGGLLLTCAALLVACGGGGTPDMGKPGGGTGKPPAEGAAPGAAETQMLQAVNTARATARKCQGKEYAAAPALAWNGLLGNAALAHARDMAARHYFAHVSPDGRTVQVRAEAAGYIDWRALGENIAAGYSESQVSEVMTDWLASTKGHCEALMNPAFKDVGFGHAPSTGGEYSAYWVQDFGSR